MRRNENDNRDDRLELETHVPARAASLTSDVLVPLAQAAITGATIGAFFTFLVGQINPRAGHLLEVWAGLTLLLGAIFWVLLLLQHRRLLWAIERRYDLDLNRDGVKGPPPAPRTIRVEVKYAGTGHTDIITAEWLEMDDENLVRFARGLVAGRRLVEGEWAKDAAFPGRINEFKRVRAKLEEKKYIRRINPNASNSTWELTFAGRALMRHLADWEYYQQTEEEL